MPVTTTTREELYEKVWQTPMRTLAGDFGISDVGLKKVCKRHRIPVPGRGFWARKEAGRPVGQPKLECSDEFANRIVIRGRSAGLPDSVRAALEAAHDHPSDIRFATTRDELHPKVLKTLGRLSRARPDERGLVTCDARTMFDVAVAPESIERAGFILDALVRASETRGFKLVRFENILAFEVEDEIVPFRLCEKVDRKIYKPSTEEQAALAKWEAEQDERLRKGDWRGYTPRPDWPQWEFEPVGRLSLLLGNGGYGYEDVRRSFNDGRKQRLEDCLPRILDAITVWSAAIKAKRAEDEERARQWKEEARLRREAERLAALDRKRVEALSKDMQLWRQHKLVLEYVAEVETRLQSGGLEDGEELQTWIAWARDYAERSDPLAKGAPRLLQIGNLEPWDS